MGGGGGKEEADVSWKLGLVNSTTPKIWQNRAEIISEFVQNESRIKLFWKHEKSKVYETLLKGFNPYPANVDNMASSYQR